jgi:hypothetical protein
MADKSDIDDLFDDLYTILVGAKQLRPERLDAGVLVRAHGCGHHSWLLQAVSDFLH